MSKFLRFLKLPEWSWVDSTIIICSYYEVIGVSEAHTAYYDRFKNHDFILKISFFGFSRQVMLYEPPGGNEIDDLPPAASTESVLS